jgi:cytochrome c-type biogenesis protein CcmH
MQHETPFSAPLSRRRFVATLGVGIGASLLARALPAQDAATAQPNQSVAGSVSMDGEFYKPCRRPPKPGAKRLLTNDQRDALEHQIACPCPCTLDVFTCRTTDFSCGNSPAVHRDVMALVDGGYSGDEIIAAMVETYGEQILMQPKRQGFNLVGYFAPFVAIGVGGFGVLALMRRWGARARATAAASASASVASPHADASVDELARLEAAVRDDARS